MLKLEDLYEYDYMYYIGNIIDVDGDGWVNKEDAIAIIELINLSEK